MGVDLIDFHERGCVKEFKIEMKVEGECPICGGDKIEILHASAIQISSGKGKYMGEELENDKIDEDLLIFGYCEQCKGKFKVFLGSMSPSDSEMLEFKEIIPLMVDYNKCGFPVSILIGATKIPISGINYAPDVKQDDPLYGWPPFGFYTIWTRQGSFKLEISLALKESISSIKKEHETWYDGNYLQASIRKADRKFLNFIESLPKTWGHIIKNRQEMPSEILMAAAYRQVMQVETLVRRKIWLLLKERYGVESDNWWTGILPGEMVKYIKDNAKKSSDKDFVSSSPVDYLTVGHCRDLLRDKWDKVFKDHFERKEDILRQLQIFEDSRNPIAHFRCFTFDDYIKFELACREILKIFV
jgi:hypothetical protein